VSQSKIRADADVPRFSFGAALLNKALVGTMQGTLITMIQ